MPMMRVVDREGVEHEVKAEAGLKLMEVLRDLDFGIPAICGGMCSCGTCVVYVDPESAGSLPSPQQTLLYRTSNDLGPIDSRMLGTFNLPELVAAVRRERLVVESYVAIHTDKMP